MRILHVLDHSIPLQSGYTFRTLAILKHQHSLGWETFHLTTPKHTLAAPPTEIVEGLRFYRTTSANEALGRVPLLSELDLVKSTAERLDAVIREVRPDIIHAHSPVLNALAAFWARRRHGLPVVYEVRAFWEDAAVSHGTGRTGDLRYRVVRQLETFALRQADAVTTICEGLKRDIIQRGLPPQKVTVIPNAVDIEAFPPPPYDAALAAQLGVTDKVVLGFFGSFYRYEGLHLLLEAMPALLRGEPRIRLLLAGGGPEDEALRARARELGLDDTVLFLGRIDHDQIQRYYGLADILVYPRLSMRLTELVTPLKPLEAMAQGKLVIASNVGGHRELIEDRVTGNLFAPDSPDALAACVAGVLGRRDEWPALRANARAFVERERTWPFSVARYADVYRGMLTARAAA